MLNIKILVQSCFCMANLSLVFTESQHLKEFSPMINVSLHWNKRIDFYTYYFIGIWCIGEYMSSKHQNRNFIVEQENIGLILFLSVNICRKNDKFVTSVFRKPIFTGVFTCNKSFISTYQKRGLLHTVYRDFSI